LLTVKLKTETEWAGRITTNFEPPRAMDLFTFKAFGDTKLFEEFRLGAL